MFRPSRFVVQASSAVDRSSSSSSSSMVTPKRKFLSALPKQKQSNSANSPTPATAVSLATPAASPSSATAAAAVAAAAATAANWLAPVVKAVEGAGSALGTFGLVIQSKKDHLVAGAVSKERGSGNSGKEGRREERKEGRRKAGNIVTNSGM